MLRTLWKNVKETAQANVPFLLISVLVILFFAIPLSLLNGHLSQNTAHAGVFSSVGQGILEVLGTALGFILKLIAWLIFKITGLIFVISGKFFEYSMIFSLSGTLFSSFTFINSGWVIIRDLINSLFIFSVLYVAMKQLFTFSGVTNEVKKTITNIIIAALLINFSLFFTKAAIDVSNFTSRALFYSMESKTDKGEIVYGPANALVTGLNIEKLLNPDDQTAEDKNKEDVKSDEATQLQRAIAYLGGSAVHVVGAIIFFTMAFFFVVRIVILIILMLTSPVFFLSFVINSKQTNELKSKWFSNLTGQLVFPVIFMVLIYVAVNIVNAGILQNKDGLSFSQALTSSGSGSGFSLIINLAIVIAMMVFAMQTAKKYSGAAGAIGGKLAGLTAGAAFGGMALMGRQTLGRLGGQIARNESVKGWASSENKFKRFVGDKVTLKGAKAMYEGSWDVRNQKQLGQAYGMANKQTGAGLNVGKATTKNTKNDVREVFGKKSGDGKKKDAAYQTAKVNTYGSVEARVAEAKARLGNNINEKEYKEFREKLIGEIRESNKDKPKKQKELIEKLVGTEAYNGKADYDTIRSEINRGIAKEEFNEVKKKIEETTKDIKTKQKEIKELGDTTGDADKTAKKAKLEEELKTAKETAETKLKEKKEIEVGGKKVIQPSLMDQFKEKAKKAPADSVRSLAISDIDILKSQLSKAHLEALNKKYANQEYSEEDAKELNEMIRKMRTDDTTSKEIKDWINNSVAKGISGFDLKMNEDISKALADIPHDMSVALSEAQQKTFEQLLKVVRQVTDVELSKLKVEEVTHERMLEHLSPMHIKKYAEHVMKGNDMNQKAILDHVANEIYSGRMYPTMSDNRRNQYMHALRGLQPPKGNQNSNNGPQRQQPPRTP